MHHYTKSPVKSAIDSSVTILDAASPSVRDTRRNQPIWDAKLAAIRKHSMQVYLANRRGKSVRFVWERTV